MLTPIVKNEYTYFLHFNFLQNISIYITITKNIAYLGTYICANGILAQISAIFLSIIINKSSIIYSNFIGIHSEINSNIIIIPSNHEAHIFEIIKLPEIV